MGYIYILENKINGKCYVGQTTKSVQARLLYHINGHRPRDNTKIGRAIKKYGKGNFNILSFIIKNCDLDSIESRTISALDSMAGGYNLESGGNKNKKLSLETCKKISQSLMGHVVSKKTRIKLSKSNKGRVNIGWVGKTHSLEAKQKMSKANKGKKLSSETKRKIGNASRGRIHSEATKRKMSKAHKGKVGNWLGLKHSEKTKEKISNSLRGHVVLESTRKKLSKANKGNRLSKKTRLKISISLKGYYEQKTKNLVLCNGTASIRNSM